MKNRIVAALLALVTGALLYLPAAHAAPARKTAAAAAPAELTALLKAVPAAADALLAAAVPDADAIAELKAQVRTTVERQQGPVGIDLAWWQSHYNDIIGYVYSPGTPISYPIAYDGNNVLYGHHMSDGSMFASISNYKQQWYYDAHPYYFVYTNKGTYRVDLFAGIIVPGTHEVFSTSLSTDQLQRFINESTFYSGRGVPSGQIMTLCTCSYEAANYRYVVLGEMVLLEDTATEETA